MIEIADLTKTYGRGTKTALRHIESRMPVRAIRLRRIRVGRVV